MSIREPGGENPTKVRPGDQVLPTASRNLPVAHEEVIEDLQERLRIGIERYGQGLRPFNGRNTLQDEYEELLDQIVYKKTQLLMRSVSREVLIEQVAQVMVEWALEDEEAAIRGQAVHEALPGRIVDRLLDCFTGSEAKAPDAR